MTTPDPDVPEQGQDAIRPAPGQVDDAAQPDQVDDQPSTQAYDQRPGQGFEQPPGQGFEQPPAQGFEQPPAQPYPPPPADEGYQQPPPGHGFAPAPPVPAGYGYGEYPASAVPAGMYVDQASGLALPDGTQLASVGRRIGAWFLAIALVIATLGVGYIVWGLVIWSNGQTPALQVLGMRCWRPETNRVAGFWYMALREIVGRFVEGILGIFTETASFVMMCAGRERKAIHDWIAGTVVLHDPDKRLAR